MGAHNYADVAASPIRVKRCAPQATQVVSIRRARVNGDVAAVGITHQIAVGAGPGHHAGVGGRQAQYVFE